MNAAAPEFIPSASTHTGATKLNVAAGEFIPSRFGAAAEQSQFEEKFPSLGGAGGGGVPAPINAPVPVSAEPGFLEKQSLMGLKDKFEWVPE